MPYTKTLFYLLAILVFITLYNRIKTIRINKEHSLKEKLLSLFKGNVHISDFWIVSSCIILTLYFIIPDSGDGAGFVSVRLGLLFFILLIIWLSAQAFPKWLRLLFVGIMLCCHFILIIYYTSTIRYLNKIAVNCNNAAEHIAPNSTILPLNYSDNWLVGNFYGYLGIDKPLIILENYECSMGYFPLKWNDNSIPNTLLGNISSNQLPCLIWKGNTQNPPLKIEYVFVLGDNDTKIDSCNQRIKNAILNDYEIIYQNEDCKLFRVIRASIR